MVFEYVNKFNCSKEEAFSIFTNMDRRPEFIDIMDKSEWLQRTEDGLGSIYREKLTFIGFPLNIDYEVTDYRENEIIASKCHMPPFHPVITIKVRDEGKKCSASLTIDINLGPLEWMPKFLIKKQVDNIVDRFVKNYRKVLDK